MMEEIRARVAPAARGPELTEQVNVLLSEETRAFLLGSKQADNARSEAEVARALITAGIERYAKANEDAYVARVVAGRKLMRARKAPAKSVKA